MLRRFVSISKSPRIFRQSISTRRIQPKKHHHRSLPPVTRTDDPTSHPNIITALICGAAAGTLFISVFEDTVWGGEHDHVGFRIPGEDQLKTKTEDETVYEATSGVPVGVIGDIWKAINPNVIILEESSEPIQRMLAQVRDHRTSGAKFVFYANRLWMLLLEQALCEIDEMEDYLVLTPSGHRYKGSFLPEGVKLCGISLQTNVVEANTQALHSLLQSLQRLLNAEGCNLSQFGEVVVNKSDVRDSADHVASAGDSATDSAADAVITARLSRRLNIPRTLSKAGLAASVDSNQALGGFVSKSVLPSDISDRYALIVHPTLSTGTSALVAVKHLVEEKNVPEDHIMVLVLLACPASIESMNQRFPKVKIVSAALDSHLDSKTKRIVPGLGDFGARYAYKATADYSDEDSHFENARSSDGGLEKALELDFQMLKRRKTRRALANRRR